MAAGWTSLKLGLFTLAGIAAAAIVVVVLGVQALHEETVEYHTYFDEAVTGLDIGAPVRFRGVPAGTVSHVAIARDGRHVDVTSAIRAAEVPRLAWSPAQDTGLRAQLEIQGLTGVKLVNVDFVDPKTHPPPVLPFPTAERYIPATQSLLGGLENSLERTADQLPDVIHGILAALAHLQRIFDDYDQQHLPARIAGAIEDLHVAVADFGHVARGFDQARIPEKAAASLARLDTAVAGVSSILERVDGDAGLIASTQRATEAVSQLGRNSTGATADLDRTLRDLGDAARAVRELAGALERDPDMLVKGASKAKSR